MQKRLIKWFLLSLIGLSLPACSLFVADEQAVVFKASPQTTPAPAIKTQIPENFDECKLNCMNKSGLKKKLCIKKCQIKNKNAQSQTQPPKSDSSPNDPE